MSGESGRPVERGSFFSIFDDGDSYVLADTTRQGVRPRLRSMDEKAGVEADKGIVHDRDGTGREVPVRWFFPKARYGLDDVIGAARALEEKHARLREAACPG